MTATVDVLFCLFCFLIIIFIAFSRSCFYFKSIARVKSFTSKCDFHPNMPLLKTDRGGLLVYSPTKNNGDILSFVQPLITSLGNQVRPHITNEAWIQHMIHLHSTERTGKRNRASRGGVKRKREVKEELVWSLEKILEGLKGNSREINCNRMTGEDEAVVLQHLKQCHDGNIDAAKFNVLINFSGEKGELNTNYYFPDAPFIIRLLLIPIRTWYLFAIVIETN